MARTSRISFRDEDEIREFDIGAAIDDDVKLTKPKPKTRHSLIELARHFKQNRNRAANESGPITCKPIIHSRRKTSNSPVMPAVSCGSPTPPSLAPLPKPVLARVNRKEATVVHKTIDDDVADASLEIPEENIKTLLTLGFMSSLAFNVNESDDSDGKLEFKISYLTCFTFRIT